MPKPVIESGTPTLNRVATGSKDALRPRIKPRRPKNPLPAVSNTRQSSTPVTGSADSRPSLGDSMADLMLRLTRVQRRNEKCREKLARHQALLTDNGPAD